MTGVTGPIPILSNGMLCHACHLVASRTFNEFEELASVSAPSFVCAPVIRYPPLLPCNPNTPIPVPLTHATLPQEMVEDGAEDALDGGDVDVGDIAIEDGGGAGMESVNAGDAAVLGAGSTIGVCV